MLSFSSFVFSCRMRLAKLKHHKLALSSTLIVLMIVIFIGPPVYKESWLDPFSTLNLSNRELHPHTITMLGMLKSDDPYHPYYFSDQKTISELMHDLQHTTPVSLSDLPADFSKDQKTEFFTLHRASSKFHSEEDYALQYNPRLGVVYFRQQLFHINESAIYTLNKITNSMTPGWWKS
ncbi:hypothetical protein Desaci_2985 [Desulfosporosinus acidiphilus SJ4]|uniref:Uncharacterized protein n=1 Tax=Desulfosporosinus acidiphilus (strain DSM 22704 / JCM 16185 / SJ4) TaxID=646529 RepID=I4D7X0_DESAJ|nr:hypothetical protein [Desulfosporosinus acidiphilus]AFM41894.1 hypothetical protein Desaci_2985 [Desulfosporosinus acidiphilus SJ4]